MKKKRLDLLVVEKGLTSSRNQAQRLIMAGEVVVNGNIALKPSETYTEDAQVSIKERPPFISRGGEKLIAALENFGLTDLEGRICADVGASTGGFTDCLLQHGVQKVYAIDVGYGQLHWKLRNDERVIVMEKTNVRDLQKMPEKMDLVVVDVSFISLKVIFNNLKMFMKDEADLITLIKPQFEAGRKEAAKGKGVIKDHAVHEAVLERVMLAAEAEGLYLHGLIQSPIKGPKGNIEFLAHFRTQPFTITAESFIGKILNKISG